MSSLDTIDNIVYSKTTEPENISEKPFLAKEWSNMLFDTNTSSNYSNNQLIFDTTTLMNSGNLPNYAEGVIAIPLVIRVRGSNTAGTVPLDWGYSDSLHNGTDFMLGLKNSHTQLINSVSINMNNIDIIQPVTMTNAYLTFIQHSEFSAEDEMLNAPLHGYCKDSSSSWGYCENPTARGVGLVNNSNFGLIHPLTQNESFNEGFLKRQRLFNKYNDEKLLVLGTEERQRQYEAKSGVRTVTGAGGGKYFLYDCIIRLKDLCPSFFGNFPMSMGIKFKITLTLNNNIEFQFGKSANGLLTFNQDDFRNLTSATNPIMIAASYNEFKAQTGNTWYVVDADTNDNTVDTGTYHFDVTDNEINDTVVPQGSAALTKDKKYTVTMKIGTLDDQNVGRTQCILYVPSYTLSPKYAEEYFLPERRLKRVHFTELEYINFSTEGSSGTFNRELSSSCIRPKRLIMIPILTPSANGGIDPCSSPFTTEPATTSPFLMTAFNCAISNHNIYPNDISYSFDHYLQEINGQTGINGNLVSGLVSSRISMTDYQNNYHYIVCDLSRRLPESDRQSFNIRVRGTINSTKLLTFHCFIEKERTIEFDCLTGKFVEKT